MRTFLLLTIVVVLALGGALAVGCGGSTDEAVGTYKLEATDELPLEITIVLNEDGTFKLTGADGDEAEETVEGTWSRDGSEVTMTIEEDGEKESEKAEYKEGELNLDGLVFKKQ